MPLPMLLVTTVVTTLAGAGIFLLLVARQRRRIEESEPALAAAGDAHGSLAAAALDVPFGEEWMPRWRRPSLQAARRGSVPTADVARARLAFRGPPTPGTERRQVGYRFVRLADRPDELYGSDVGVLQQGDQVELIREQAGYWLVRTPDGTEGWLHRTTLAPLESDD